MKKLISLMFVIMVIAISPYNSYGCEAGGIGSTSCSITKSGGGLSFDFSITVSTTCGDGYYACCNMNGDEPSATCIENPKPKKPYLSASPNN